jgi:hypothetical protein
MRFQKRPVVVEAWPAKALMRAAASNWRGLPKPVADAYEQGGWVFGAEHQGRRGIFIPTLEGSMFADEADMVIRGIKGEFYPCKPDIFQATYDPVD